jgi:hypothetical protein
LTSELTVDLANGEQVLVVIDGFSGQTGNYVLDINLPLDLSCTDGNLGTLTGAGIAAGSNVGASDSLSIGCAGGGGADIVYAWTAPYAATFTFSLAGSSYDTALALRTPDCGGNEFACNDDANGTLQSQVTVDLAQGEHIAIVIDGFFGATGNFTLAIN